jgi:mono/diheme cytochrome c family protein
MVVLTFMHFPFQPTLRSARRWSAFASVCFFLQAVAQPPAVPAPSGAAVEDESITFTPPTQIYHAKAGELSATLTFRVTNVSTESTWITNVKTSCGCTVAKLPANPWLVAPGASGKLELTIDLQGKSGTLVKSATLETRRGTRTLIFQVVLPTAAAISLNAPARDRNIQMASANRQAVFAGECARCHVAPTVGLFGEALYKAACGICHEAEHRATMVPDLAKLDHPTNRDFWLAMSISGKPGTLMPGFSSDLGGPLSSQQIESIASYLAATYPSPPSAPTASAPEKSR